jgi:hypothetical protein
MALILPNTIANLIPADGDKLGQNFGVIQDYINQEVISRDGSTAMTSALLLPGPPTQPNQAATKGYVDTQDTAVKAYADDQIAAAAVVVSWIALTPVNGWSNLGGVYPPTQYRKVGDLVHLRGAIKAVGPISPTPNSSQALTLPAGFRPPYQQDLPAVVGDAGGFGVPGTVTIATDGRFMVNAASAAVQPHLITTFNLAFSVTA